MGGAYWHTHTGFHTGFFERGPRGNSWLTYLASTFGRPEMSCVPFEQVLDRKTDELKKKIAYSKGGENFPKEWDPPPV